MPGMGERAFAYAKACGIIGKSFTGKRIRRLENTTRLSELDRLIFPASPRELPERELLYDLESRITARAVNSVISILNCFSRVPEFLCLLVRSYEYSDLKSVLTALREGEKNCPPHTDIGRFQTVRFDAWPDLRAMLAGTEFHFLLDRDGNIVSDAAPPESNRAESRSTENLSAQTALDRYYYAALWKSLSALPRGDSSAARKILSDEISLKNCAWALRLRTYYKMTAGEIKPHLVDLPAYRAKPASLWDDALKCLDFPLDDYAAWASWRWKEFLGGDSSGHWQADPRRFQNAASRYLNKLAGRYFRLHPFSLDTIFCFIKLKEFEEDILTSNAEGLGMGMSGKDLLAVLEVEA